MRRAIPNNPTFLGHREPPTVGGLLKCPAPLRLTYLKPKRFPQPADCRRARTRQSATATGTRGASAHISS